MSKELQKIESLYERQEIVSNVAGFFVPTNRELSEALTVIGSHDSGGVVQHLDEIYRRQQYNRADKPENAVKAVTKEYVTSFRSAEAISRHLGALAIEISEIYNPNINIGEEIDALKPGHRAFVRFVDLKDAYSDYQNAEEQKSILNYSYFAKDKTVVEYISSRLDDIKIKDARKLVIESIEDQANRSIFWLDTIKLLRTHRIAGPITRMALSFNQYE